MSDRVYTSNLLGLIFSFLVPNFQKIAKNDLEHVDKFSAKALAVMKITEVYECKSGDGAGKQLL